LIRIVGVVLFEKDFRRPVWNWLRREVFLRKDDVDQLDETDDVQLPPTTREGKLDYDIHRLLSFPITHDAWSGQREESLTAEYIRKMIEDEIAFRVHPSALNNDIEQAATSSGGAARKRFEAEREKRLEAHQKAEKKRSELLAAVRLFAAESGISEEWLLKNGGFQPTPLAELRLPLGGFPASSYVGMFCGGRIKDTKDYEMISLLSHDLHRFGSELGYSSLDEAPSDKLEIILQYKDRMLDLLNNSR
jgi:hypothetical protein